MKTKVGRKPKTLGKSRSYYSSLVAVIVAVGVAGSALAAMNAALVNNDLNISRAKTAASAFSADDIQNLSGQFRDTDNPDYQSLKRRLTRIRQDNPGTRFSYILGHRDSGVFFYVNSELPGSSGYAPPGQAYTEATPALLAAFSEDQAFIKGPSRDSYGNWISALAPIVDQSTGQTVAVFGIDVPASSYYSQIAIYGLIPLLLAAIPLTVLIRNRRLESKEREVTKLKTQFVSIASHELRSPLSGTLWGIQSLLSPSSKQNLSSEQEQILTSVYNNTAASLATVNEILDFSIFDRPRTEKFQKEPVNLAAVLNDVHKLFSLTAKESKVEIKYAGQWPSKIPTIGDPSALKRAFSNIMSNAIKYSPTGGRIELGYKLDGKNHVIGVRDHGIGIPKSAQKKVLKGYFRAPNAAKVKTHGTGMGLWVTKKIINKHHGKIELSSEVGKGTTIFVFLPVASSKPPRR